ncbi:type 1 glutamine amidotransferase [Hansschlegelia quercus]|uniref:Type 1 glutamine amidotransferase n=1 Tax=Hansschlegelia quercus TaxID=2528245 RepID=A0A4Q9GJ80_9HYPH|nr:type 1 glutamine amidotransferase [Hansschlegelia quercus]TBN52508.1 type 1 glutamine amidotransferase [Hansschlegelia quercus]
MDVTVIQHSPSGHAGLIGDYVVERLGATLRTLYSDALLHASVDDLKSDAVVVMGSARGVYETEIPWIARQRELMRGLVESGVPVFGVCFGAQLLATAIGGDVRPTGDFHLGWRENPEASTVWKGPWLRWHGDHVSLPADVEVMARADGLVQAFARGSAVGVQFHPEASSDMLDRWSQEAMLKGRLAEQASDVAAYARQNAEAIRAKSYDLFDHVFARLAGGGDARS